LSLTEFLDRKWDRRYEEHVSIMEKVIPAASRSVQQPEWNGVGASLLLFERHDRIFFPNAHRTKHRHKPSYRPAWDVLIQTPMGDFYAVSIESDVDTHCVGAAAVSCARFNALQKLTEKDAAGKMTSWASRKFEPLLGNRPQKSGTFN
jgi:hypothetical protein